MGAFLIGVFVAGFAAFLIGRYRSTRKRAEGGGVGQPRPGVEQPRPGVEP